MASIIENQVVYIEPNAEVDLGTAYEADDNGIQAMKFANPEDFCIVVDLEVEVKGRTFYFTKNSSDGTIKKVEATENSSGQHIRFMEGTKIYTDKEKSSYITSLTTNYTDCTLQDVENGGTSEMFGIKSIDISYNNFMVPEVTIQFVDVRGVSLFAQEEMRHNLVNASNGMQGNVNNDIQGSFFKCFFTFPYPKFTLKVKGFYGQKVSYELTCSDFRAAFDSATGNFNVTAKFIGYAFSFLNDVMANGILAAPYSTYIGSDYWEQNNGSRFTVKDKNGVDVPMSKLMDICKQYNSIKESVEKRLSDNGGLAEEAQKQGKTDEEIAAMTSYDLNEEKTQYQTLTDGAKQRKYNGSGNGEDCVTSSSHSFAVFVDDGDDYDTWRDWAKSFSDFDTKLRGVSGCTQLSTWLKSNHFELKEYSSYMDITVGDSETEISANVIKDKSLKDAIERRASETCTGTEKQYHELWTDWDDSHVFVYIDNGLYDILGNSSDAKTDKAEEAQSLKEEVTNTAINNAVADVFNFPPTVENVTKTIMAHFETYAYMIAKCSQQIIDSGTARSPENLGLSQDTLNDLPEGSSLVPPFPSVTENKTDEDGNEKVETTWIGKFDTAGKFEEIKLVEGLLKGLAKTAEAVAAATSESGVTDTDKSNIDSPTSTFDLFLGDNDNPFGTVNLSDANNVFAHAAMHGFASMATMKNGLSGNDLGTKDADNFVQIYKGNSNINSFKQILSNGDITGDSLYDYLSSGDLKKAPNKSAKNNPWYLKPRLFMDLTDDTSYCTTSPGDVEPNKQGRVLPVKNWTFAQLKEQSSGQSHKYLEKYPDNFYVTPITNESYNIKSNVCKIKYKACKYFANTLGSSSDLFSDALKSPSEAIKVYSLGQVLKSDGKYYNCDATIQYDEQGGVTNGSEFALKFSSCFENEAYYSKGLYEKAKYFLDSFTASGIDGLKQTLYDDTQKIRVFPKFTVLKLGALLYDYCEVQKKTYKARKGIIGALVKEFKNWAAGGFKTIQSQYELQFKNGKSYATLKESLTNTSAIKAINANCSNASTLNSVYNIVDKTGRSIQWSPKISSASKILAEDLCQMAHFVIMAKFNDSDYDTLDSDGPCVKKTEMKAYLNGFVTELRSKLNVSTDQQESNGATQTGDTDGNDIDDIKFGVYVYLKMLYDKWISSEYDKWISSNLAIPNYRFETMFGGSDPTFHFIDSYYNKIGKSYYINIATLVKMCVDSQTQNGYSLLSLLSNLYASNKMQFLCIQNFADLANSDMMQKMFKPIPYIDMLEPSNHPDFVVLYPGETSSKLEIKDGDYKDDGFYLNDRNTWPIMIKNKQGGYPIPAFGVSYGQQYQSYFKNIQVDMNTPMVTEQSIKAKFMIAGGMSNNDNNGPKQITIGQDLYTIYSNNSYQCTVTMMGCAWVQPMMYFVLLNVPMFRGSYMIFKVNHQIQAGSMTTTFTGVRMANTSTRAVRQYIAGQNNDSTNGDSNSYESQAAANANLGNDCAYAEYSPLGGQAGMADVNGIQLCEHSGKKYTPSAEQKKNMSSVIPLMKQEGSKMKYGMPWTILPATTEYETGWHTKSMFEGTTNPSSTAKGLGQILYGTASSSRYKKYFPNLIKGTGKDDRNVPEKAVPAMAQMMSDAADDVLNGITLNGKKHGPYTSLKSDPTKLAFCAIARYHDYYAMVNAADVLTSHSLQDAINNKLFTDDGCKKLYWFYNNYKKYGSATVNQNSGNDTKNDTLGQLVSGFTNAVQSSLNATESYKTVKLTYEVGKKGNDWALIQIKGTGTNAMNAAFDCISTTYTNYYEYLYWSVGNGKPDNDCVGVVVKLKTSKPATHRIGVCKLFTKNDSNAQPIFLTKESEVNKSFRLTLIKHCRKEGITDVTKAKACIKSLQNMNDDTIKKVLELDKTDNSLVQSCDSVTGGYGGDTSGGSVTMTKGLSAANDMSTKSSKKSKLFGGNIPTSAAEAKSWMTTFSFKGKDINGNTKTQSVTIHKNLADSLKKILEELYAQDFRVASIGGFCWRATKHGGRSNHSYGAAVDINAGLGHGYYYSGSHPDDPSAPNNPWYDGWHCKMNNRSTWTKGANSKTRIRNWESVAVNIFANNGWGWGGQYGDTMHFSYFGGS